MNNKVFCLGLFVLVTTANLFSMIGYGAVIGGLTGSVFGASVGGAFGGAFVTEATVKNPIFQQVVREGSINDSQARQVLSATHQNIAASAGMSLSGSLAGMMLGVAAGAAGGLALQGAFKGTKFIVSDIKKNGVKSKGAVALGTVCLTAIVLKALKSDSSEDRVPHLEELGQGWVIQE